MVKAYGTKVLVEISRACLPATLPDTSHYSKCKTSNKLS